MSPESPAPREPGIKMTDALFLNCHDFDKCFNDNFQLSFDNI